LPAKLLILAAGRGSWLADDGAGQLNRIVRFYCRCAADRRQVNSHAWRQKLIAAISENAITCRSELVRDPVRSAGKDAESDISTTAAQPIAASRARALLQKSRDSRELVREQTRTCWSEACPRSF
jgi:hypothetical protein